MARAATVQLRNADYADWFRRVLMQNYAPAPVAFVRGQGTRLWDADGKSYLDLAAGVAVCSTGHAHPKVVAALAEQARQVLHTSNLYLIPNQLRLAQDLVDLSGLSRAFFCNSGAEAVEAALKLARYWGHERGGRTDIITTDHSFHGRTYGALSATNQAKYRQGFDPLLPGIQSVPFGDVPAVRRAITPRTCAVLVEPIQGEGGVHVPPSSYLSELRLLCDERDLLLILDEVQTGIGRTGGWFAYQAHAIRPDVLALAKGLASGVPIGALLCNERANVFTPGTHGSTFGGNPLACAAALATLQVIREENLLLNVRSQGARLMGRLGGWEKRGRIRDLRGAGLLIGFDLPGGEAKALARKLLDAGLLVTNIQESTIRICPPLTVSAGDVDEALGILDRVLPG